MTPREAALKVAVLETLQAEVDKARKAARTEAQEVFAAVRADGQTQQKVLLPDGEEIGLISIRGGGRSVDWDGGMDVLIAWCREHAPHMVESYVLDVALDMNDVVALIRERFPNLVAERVRTSSLAALLKQVQETDGYIVDEDGEKHKAATVTQEPSSGAFAYRAAKGAQDRIMREWLDGKLREVAFGPLALPAPKAGAS